MSDFRIENGELVEYTGKGGETLWTRTQKADHETGAADNK